VLLGGASDEVAALGDGAGWPTAADVAPSAGLLGRGWPAGAGPAPPQAAVTAQATAITDAAARARHRFLLRCTPRL
jgi:hypothetical protein